MSHHEDLHSHMEVEGLQFFCWLVLSRNKKPRKEKHFNFILENEQKNSYSSATINIKIAL